MLWYVLKQKYPKINILCTDVILLSTITWNISRNGFQHFTSFNGRMRVVLWPALLSQKNIHLNTQALSFPHAASPCYSWASPFITYTHIHTHALLLAAPPEHICHHRSTFIPSLMEKLTPICKKDRKGKRVLPWQQRGYVQTLMEINIMCQAALSSGKLEK